MHAEKFCIIGGGPSGLTVAKNFLQQGIPFDLFEREDDVGGNWYFGKPSSSVYASTHLISSKRLTEFTDYPMPEHFPAYPSHRQVLEYLRSYARRFGLYDHIHFHTTVRRVERTGEGWHVEFEGGRPAAHYAGLVIANGHHWDPLWPQWEGQFTGELMHAHDYKTPEQLRGRRVLVVGAGNSGCDIAVEAAQHGAAALLSMRRGYHFLPKFLFGKPIDECGDRLHRWRLPLAMRRAVAQAAVAIAVGSPRRYGLPLPDHKLFESHPIINSQVLYYAGHGALQVVPDVQRLEGPKVCFQNGREEVVDLIIAATGYKVSFPFLDASLLLHPDGRPRLALNAYHPEWDDLFVAGLIQPNSGLWGLADLQAQVYAAFLVAKRRGAPAADWFREWKRHEHRVVTGGVEFLDSPRHRLEVDYYPYRQKLKKLLRELTHRGVQLQPVTADHAGHSIEQ